MSFRFAAAAAASIAMVFSACGQETGDDAVDQPEVTVEAAKADPENWRAVDPENLLVFETTKGRILIEVLPQAAPKHAEQFKTIIGGSQFDGTVFHRVIAGFMAQGGDIFALNGLGSGLPNIPGEFDFRRSPTDMPLALIGDPATATQGYYMGFPMQTQPELLAEMTKDKMVDSWILHCKGMVSTARTDDLNSANSQFFLMRDTSPHLDRTYTAWGRILDGQSAVDTIKLGEPVENPDILRTARIAADLPEEQRPSVWVQRTDGPQFQEALAAQGETPICELPPVPTVVEG
ncbi:MAG: peptidylprolyl isomerase [Pseudomonadota bacterium]